MKRLLIISFILFSGLFVYPQGWRFNRYFPNSDFKGKYGGTGVAVDPDGKVWIQLFDASDSIMTSNGSYDPVKAIYVFNADGTSAPFSAIKTVTVGGITDTLWNFNRGIRADNNGNILFSSYSMLYRINYKTGEGMNKFSYPNGGYLQPLTTPAADSMGNIFVASVLYSNPIQILDKNFVYIKNAVNSSEGYSRTLEVSKDGNTIYWCGFSNNCVYIYNRPNSSAAFTLTDTVMKGFQCEAVGWDPGTGYLWASSGSKYGGSPNQYPGTKTNYSYPTFYAWDTNTWTIKDSIKWKASSSDEDARPRGIAFSKTGDTAYVTCFGSNSYPAVEMFTRDNVFRVPEQYSTVQEALNAAHSGDTVMVQPGTYHENIVWPAVNGIKLIAAGNYDNTIIDGSGNGSVIDFTELTEIDSSTEICGFGIFNGGNVQRGAGISCPNSCPLIKNSLIKNNRTLSGGFGGGIYSGGIIVKNSIITGNYAGTGGGLYIDTANASTLFNVIFTDNSSVYGGAIYCASNKNVDFSHVSMAYNKANMQGGGIKIKGSVGISNTTFYDNEALEGGAIYCEEDSSAISGNTFIQNDSTKNSAIFLSAGLVPRIENNNFFDIKPSLAGDNISVAIDAPSNYWGNSAGPYSPTQNPGGVGDTVAGSVNILPFLTVPDTTAPPVPPKDLSFIINSGSSISLSWNKSTIGDLKGYRVYWDTDSSAYDYDNFADAGTDTSYTITGLIPGNIYHVSVTCYDNSGNESWFSSETIVKTIPPILTLSADQLVFSNTAVGDSSVLILKISSSNSATLSVNSLQKKLEIFGLSLSLPDIVNSGDTLKLRLTFKPSGFGDFLDTLFVGSNGGNTGVILHGASPAPTIILTSDSIDFGTIVPKTNVTEYIWLKNTSVNELEIDSIYTLTDKFVVSPVSGTIQENDSLKLSIVFSPKSFGPYKDTVYVLSNSSVKTARIPLKGSLTYQLLFSGSNLDFGSVAIGNITTESIKLGNLFNGSTTIDSIYTSTPEFSVNPAKAVFDGTDSLEIEIDFKPDAFKTFVDSVLILNKETSTAVIINLKGISPFPFITVDNNNMMFDTVEVDSSITKFVTITDSSLNDLVIDSIYVAEKAFKAKLSSSAGIIKGGENAELSLEFHPSHSGSFSDTVFVINNSEVNPFKIFVSGTAIITTGVTDKRLGLPKNFAVHQNYPNPFNPSTTIRYDLPKASNVQIIIYNSLGRIVATLISEAQNAGYYTARWDAGGFASGVYFCIVRLKPLDSMNEVRSVKKLLLLK